MKRIFLLIVVSSLCAVAALSQQSGTPSPNAVVHVATALNHLTVLEFHEPVTMAALAVRIFRLSESRTKSSLSQSNQEPQPICSCGPLPGGLPTSLKSHKK